MANVISGVFPGIKELGKGYRDGSFHPGDVINAALDKVVKLDPSLNAFAFVMTDTARADAVRAAKELAAGKDRGPLHGIPVAIKDLIEVAGAPTGYGSKVRPPRIADHDAPVVARLRVAGAVIVGKTNLLEYAYGIAHPDIGQTNNPHDTDRTAGGSSGGSAAAVAAGIVPLAIGTDTGGSIRIPAAYCGIVGLKPSFDLVPMEDVFPLSWSLDHAGPLTRNVHDCGIALACLTGAELPLTDTAIAGLRVGVLRRHFPQAEAGKDLAAKLDAALEHLRAAGARITEMDIPELDEANGNLVKILCPEAALIHEKLLAENPAGYAPATCKQIQEGALVPATEYVKAQRFRAAFRDIVELAFSNIDVLVSPSVPYVAPFEDPTIETEGDSEMLASGFANLTGHPSLSLPCGAVDGLPVGMQLTGPLGNDAKLLSAAKAIEAALG